MKRIVWILLAVVAVLTVMRFLSGPPGKEAAGYRRVPVQRGDVVLTFNATGVVAPQNRVEVKAPVAGRVESVLVQEGQAMQKGQVLAWMSSTERAYLLDAAWMRGPEQYERWKTNYNATPVLAPLDGSVIARIVEPGQAVSPWQTLLVMSDRLILRTDVDETDIGRIEVGMPVTATLDAYPDDTFTGTVDQVAYEARLLQNVTMYEVEVLPTNAPSFLKSGMTANVAFVAATREKVLVLPVGLLKISDAGAEVLVPGGAGAEQQPQTKQIRTGLSDGKVVEILEGLKEGDIVLERTSDLSKKQQGGFSIPFLPKAPSTAEQDQGPSGPPAGG